MTDLSKQAVEALHAALGNKTKAAKSLGIARGSFHDRLKQAEKKGFLKPEPIPVEGAPSQWIYPEHRVPDQAKSVPPGRSGAPLEDPVGWLGTKLKAAGDRGVLLSDEQRPLIDSLRHSGLHISERDPGHYVLDRAPRPAYLGGPMVEIMSDENNHFQFGAMGDTHVGSQYHREDVLNDLYRRYAEAEIASVFHTGNYIEGEARFNRHELTAHSMQGQVNMLVRDYPRIKGLTTYAITGDDHEGWYAQHEGINVGRFTEDAFHHAGRHDWVDIGFMEAHIKLVNRNTGKFSIMAVVHPGGGSAYATSYTIQKIIESLDGGEKPAVGLYGHYHKLMAMNIRNVWAVQTGCTKDQDSFMRKKRLEAHVGGCLIDLEQDPETGAITAMTPQMFRYFVRGYYADRWRYGEPVNLPNRGV